MKTSTLYQITDLLTIQHNKEEQIILVNVQTETGGVAVPLTAGEWEQLVSLRWKISFEVQEAEETV